MAALRVLVEERDQSIVDLLDERLAVMAGEEGLAALDRRIASLEGEQASLRRSVSVKLDALSGSIEVVEWRTQEGLAQLTHKVAEFEASLTELARSLTEVIEGVDARADDRSAAMEALFDELAETFEARQQEVARAVLASLEPVRGVMQLVQTRLVAEAAEDAGAEGSLFAKLAEREERLLLERDEAVADLLAEFALTLKPRERAKVAAQLAQADQARRKRHVGAPGSATPGPVTDTPRAGPHAGAGGGPESGQDSGGWLDREAGSESLVLAAAAKKRRRRDRDG